MEPASVEYAKGWGYEVTFPGEADPVEVSEADVDSEFARRFGEPDTAPRDADAAKRGIAEEIARGRRDAPRRRRHP